MDELDRETSERIEAFRRQMERNAEFFKQAVVYMAAERLRHDAYTIRTVPLSRPGLWPRVWRVVSRPARWVKKRRRRREKREQEATTYTIIDAKSK